MLELAFSSTPVALTAPESAVPSVNVFEDKVYIVYAQSYSVNGVQVRDVFLIKSHLMAARLLQVLST